LLVLIALYQAIALKGEAAEANIFLASATLDSPPSLRALAFKRHLENQPKVALDFYQKAIDKSIKDYGPESSYTARLYFEMGLLALDMSKFTLADHCFTKAIQINPNSATARLKLAELLRLRERPELARSMVQKSMDRHLNSPEAYREMVVWLQERNPAAATKESFMISQILNGNISQLAPQPISAVGQVQSPTTLDNAASNSLVKPLPGRTPIMAPGESNANSETSNKLVKSPPPAETKTTSPKQTNSSTKAQTGGKNGSHEPLSPAKSNTPEASNKSKTSLTKITINTTAKNTSTKFGAREQKNRTQHQHKQRTSKVDTRGLVPPPPPTVLIPQIAVPRSLSGPQSNFQKDQSHLNTNTKPKDKLKEKDKQVSPSSIPEQQKSQELDQTPPKQKKETTKQPSGQDNDTDFLLDWADVKKKDKK